MKYSALALAFSLVATPIVSEPSDTQIHIPLPAPIEVAAIDVPGSDIEEITSTRQTPAQMDKNIKENMRAGILLLMILGEMQGNHY